MLLIAECVFGTFQGYQKNPNASSTYFEFFSRNLKKCFQTVSQEYARRLSLLNCLNRNKNFGTSEPLILQTKIGLVPKLRADINYNPSSIRVSGYSNR